MKLLQINAENTINIENVKILSFEKQSFLIYFMGEDSTMSYTDDGSVDFKSRYYLNFLNGFVEFKRLGGNPIFLRKSLIKSLTSESDGKFVDVEFDDTRFTFEMNYKELIAKLTDTRL